MNLSNSKTFDTEARVRITSELLGRIERQARRLGLNVSSLIRLTMTRECARLEEDERQVADLAIKSN